MSFWPFPKTLLAEFASARARGPVVEIGAGRGGLCARLRAVELDPIAFDLRPRELEAVPRAVAGDATALPFATGSIGACVLADVLRHLRAPTRVAAARECARVLVGGGRVIVLEDSPHAVAPAERNYRRTLELLARFDPARGCVTDVDDVSSAFVHRFGVATLAGRATNEEAVHDALAPLRWMRARASAAEDLRALDELEGAIERDGMAHGAFDYRVFVRAATPAEERTS